MKNIKQFFTYVVVGALVIALSISCKSNEEPESPAFKYSDLVGTWTGGGNSFTVNSAGSISFVYEGATYTGYLSGSMEQETSQVSLYLYNRADDTSSSIRKALYLRFNSSSSCDVTVEEQVNGMLDENGVSLGNFTK